LKPKEIETRGQGEGENQVKEESKMNIKTRRISRQDEYQDKKYIKTRSISRQEVYQDKKK